MSHSKMDVSPDWKEMVDAYYVYVNASMNNEEENLVEEYRKKYRQIAEKVEAFYKDLLEKHKKGEIHLTSDQIHWHTKNTKQPMDDEEFRESLTDY